MVTEKVKIVTHITPEADRKVEAFMKKAGMTKARVCSLAIMSGIDALTMAFDPSWKEYFEAKMKTEIEKDK